MTSIPWLTILGVIPLVGALVLMVLPRDNVRLIKQAALVFSLAALVFAFVLLFAISRFAPGAGSRTQRVAEEPVA